MAFCLGTENDLPSLEKVLAAEKISESLLKNAIRNTDISGRRETYKKVLDSGDISNTHIASILKHDRNTMVDVIINSAHSINIRLDSISSSIVNRSKDVAEIKDIIHSMHDKTIDRGVFYLSMANTTINSESTERTYISDTESTEYTGMLEMCTMMLEKVRSDNEVRKLRALLRAADKKSATTYSCQIA